MPEVRDPVIQVSNLLYKIVVQLLQAAVSMC